MTGIVQPVMRGLDHRLVESLDRHQTLNNEQLNGMQTSEVLPHTATGLFLLTTISQTPRSSENDPSYRRTSEHYVYVSESRESSRHPPSTRERSAIDSSRRLSPERTIVRPARTGSGRSPSAYRRQQQNQQASSARDQPAHLASRAHYSEQHSFQSRRQSSSHQNSEELPYPPNTSRLGRNEEAISDDYEQTFQSLDIRDRAQRERQRVPLTTPIITQHNPSHMPISSGQTHYDSNAHIPLGRATAGQVSASEHTTSQITSASASSRPSESTFRTTLRSALLVFANVPRNDWEKLKSRIQKDPSLLVADPKLFLTEAIHAYAAGKDEYANQCIHRVALLQRLAKCKVNTALGRMSNIENLEQPEAREFYKEYDRIRKSGKEGAKLLASRDSGSTAAQSRPAPQSIPDASDDRYPSTMPTNSVGLVSAQYAGRTSGSIPISAVTGTDIHGASAYGSTPNNRYPLNTGFPIINSHHPYPPVQGSSMSGNRDERGPVSLRSLDIQIGSIPGHYEPSSPGPRSVNPNPPPPSQEGPVNTHMISAQLPNVVSYQLNQADDGQGRFSTGRRRQSTSTLSIGDITVTGEATVQPVQQGNVGRLDSRYQVRTDARVFYKVGRVFSVLWHEPYSQTPPKGGAKDYTSTAKRSTIGKFGEQIYSTIRRMVVVREGHGYCVCIQINTYGGKGLRKFVTARGVVSQQDVDSHSIIHMTDTRPGYFQDEPRSKKRPIAVNKASPDQKLGPDSRLCYSQPHTVQHNVKAMHVGQVSEETLPYLTFYYREAQT
ncbi:hypothetical protein LTR84_002983 [Exophiala bonariae]|uniref:Uncharacterized protein n=1 Tax=Exophiala bonariae TaxID=1690606 RepID=A0AAV9N8P3_9EURO|nr:hypothetical protein LTR84_002983 [Exophiala bonariae]